MNLKSKIMIRLHSLFRITEPQSWSRVSAADVLAVPDCGKVALNKLRLYLAHRGIALRDDNPPSYWIDTLGRPKTDDKSMCVGTCPFTIVIDTNETYPFDFDSIFDKDDNNIVVPTVRKPLYLSGLADYTIQGMECDIQIERKADDLASSMSERRDIFEAELCRLNDMCEYAAVVCEYPWATILEGSIHGASAKSISRTVHSWAVRYPGVHWWFLNGRYHAEQFTFRLLEKFYWDKQHARTKMMLAEWNDGLANEI